MGRRFAASPMWSMKWVHSTSRRYVTSLDEAADADADLCSVSRRRPTVLGRFLYSIRAPGSKRNTHK